MTGEYSITAKVVGSEGITEEKISIPDISQLKYLSVAGFIYHLSEAQGKIDASDIAGSYSELLEALSEVGIDMSGLKFPSIHSATETLYSLCGHISKQVQDFEPVEISEVEIGGKTYKLRVKSDGYTMRDTIELSHFQNKVAEKAEETGKHHHALAVKAIAAFCVLYRADGEDYKASDSAAYIEKKTNEVKEHLTFRVVQSIDFFFQITQLA